MSFKVNDKVTVVDSGKQYSSYDKWVKIYANQWIKQWMDCDKCIDTSLEYTVVAKGKHEDISRMLYLIQCNDKVYIIGERGIKAVETVEAKALKVGDEVKVINVLHGAPDKTLGMKGIIVRLGKNGKCHSVDFGKPMGSWAYDEELEIVTATPKDFSWNEAMHMALDGAKVALVGRMYKKSYVYFDGTRFMWHSDMDGCDSEYKATSDSRWELWNEPQKPPKFTINSLVYNTDGTIGKIVEDKGVYKGIRKYSVSFNAIRDTVKTVDETELTEYKQ